MREVDDVIRCALTFGAASPDQTKPQLAVIKPFRIGFIEEINSSLQVKQGTMYTSLRGVLKQMNKRNGRDSI